ncbi:MAG: GNAT family N-acetyltransferase, partial [Rhizomicrobium sp.]
AQKRELRSCTNLYTPRFDLLGDWTAAEGVRDFARDLVRSFDPLDSIRLEGLDPATGAFAALIEGFRAANWIAKPYFGWAVWFERTADTAIEQYLSARPSLLRNTWKRKRAALAKAAAARWRIYRCGEEPGPFIALYESVRARSWKQAEPYRNFIPGLIRLAADAGALRMAVLFIGDVPAAAQFWIVWADRATIYKLVYAEEFSRFSPGTLLTMEMMRMVFEEDHPLEVDFGRGDDGYKRLWLSSRRECWGIEAANPRTLRGMSRSLRIKAGLARDKLRKMVLGSNVIPRPAPPGSLSAWPVFPGTVGPGPPTFHPS